MVDIYFFKVFEINSPSDKDIKNKVLILYHLTFHNDLSITGIFKNDFSIIIGFRKYHRVRLIMIRNIFIFLIYHVRDNILHESRYVCMCVNKAYRVCT